MSPVFPLLLLLLPKERRIIHILPVFFFFVIRKLPVLQLQPFVKTFPLFPLSLLLGKWPSKTTFVKDLDNSKQVPPSSISEMSQIFHLTSYIRTLERCVLLLPAETLASRLAFCILKMPTN